MPTTTSRLARSSSAASASSAVPSPLRSKPLPTKRSAKAPRGSPAASRAGARHAALWRGWKR
ncbi:MAG: hypothetical protein A3D33_09845 [Candidatus Rokubacteria bacterium RIFCSPHIGHO2_02_FULL_73_26]|nr:MAG: hypothetical protein A3D33_09845 [Candidatus Rokubacteria bacterium RIFCSPHIGHO2_02_FULL_73_26]